MLPGPDSSDCFVLWVPWLPVVAGGCHIALPVLQTIFVVFDPAKVLICISCWATWTSCITMSRGAKEFFVSWKCVIFFTVRLVIIQFWSKLPLLFAVWLRDLPAAVFPIFEAKPQHFGFVLAWWSRCDTLVLPGEPSGVDQWLQIQIQALFRHFLVNDSDSFWWMLESWAGWTMPAAEQVFVLCWKVSLLSGSVGLGKILGPFGLQLWGRAAAWIVIHHSFLGCSNVTQMWSECVRTGDVRSLKFLKLYI